MNTREIDLSQLINSVRILLVNFFRPNFFWLCGFKSYSLNTEIVVHNFPLRNYLKLDGILYFLIDRFYKTLIVNFVKLEICCEQSEPAPERISTNSKSND